MKKYIALLLSLILAISLISCSKTKEKKKTDTTEGTTAEQTDPTEVEGADLLKGRWTCPLSVESTLAINGQTLDILMGDLTPEEIGFDAKMNVYLDFNSDGSATFKQSGSEFDTFMLELYSCFYNYLSDYDIATALYEMDKATLDNNAHDQYGVSTWPEAMQEVIKSMTEQAEANPTPDAVSDITYSYSNGKVTLTYTDDSTVEVYTLNGDTLTCTETDNFNGDASVFTYSRVLTDDILLGKWYAEEKIADIEKNFNTYLEGSGADLASLGVTVPDNLTTTFIIEFTTDKKSVQWAEAPEYFDFLNEFYDAYADYISDPEVFASLYYENGMEDLIYQAEKNNMTIEEFMADELEYVRSIDETQKAELGVKVSGSFSIDGNTLTVSSETDKAIYEYNNGTLVTDYIDSELVFSKK